LGVDRLQRKRRLRGLSSRGCFIAGQAAASHAPRGSKCRRQGECARPGSKVSSVLLPPLIASVKDTKAHIRSKKGKDDEVQNWRRRISSCRLPHTGGYRH